MMHHVRRTAPNGLRTRVGRAQWTSSPSPSPLGRGVLARIPYYTAIYTVKVFCTILYYSYCFMRPVFRRIDADAPLRGKGDHGQSPPGELSEAREDIAELERDYEEPRGSRTRAAHLRASPASGRELRSARIISIQYIQRRLVSRWSPQQSTVGSGMGVPRKGGHGIRMPRSE